MASTVWNGSVDTDWNTAANWTPSGVPLASAHIQISTTNACALDQSRSCASLTIDSGATLIGGGYKLTVTSEGDAASGTEGFAVNNDGIISGNLDLEINTTTATDIDLAGTSGNFQNLKLNDASCDVTMKADCILDGTLIIAAGQLSTGTGGYGFSNLTVAGDCSIAAGATLEGNASSGATVRLYSLTVNGTYSATGGETIITGETSSGRAVDIVGTFTHNSGTLSIQSPMDTLLRWPSSSSAYHIKINDDDCIARPTGDNKPTIAGNLTITKGEFNTEEGGNDHALTVTGDMLVATGGTFTGNSSAVIMRSLELQGSATFSAPDAGGSCTISGRKNGTSRCIDVGNNNNNFSGNGGTLTFTSANGGDLQGFEHLTDADELNSLTINVSDGSGTFYLMGDTTVTGNLTITAGTLTTNNGSADKDLTVTGDVNIANGGTLTGNASAISMNSLTLGESSAGGTYNATSGTTTITGYRASTNNAIYGNGPIVHNNGTFAFTNSANYSGIEIQIESGAGSAGTYFYNLTFSGNSTYRFPYYGSSDVTVSGDLTMSGTPDIKQWRRNLIVTGDVTIGSGCVYDCEGSGVAGVSSDFTAGSLTIDSGGTFKASSGTTTITSKTSDNYGIKGGGTFTHNNGEVKVTGNAFRFPIGATYYDFTWDTSTEPCYLYSTTLGGGATIDGTQNAGYTAILGTLKINDRGFVPYNATKVFINNLIIGDTTDSANATNFDMQDSDVFDGDVIVNNILINADGQLKFGDAHAGNSDALEVRGAFRSLGGASGVVVAT